MLQNVIFWGGFGYFAFQDATTYSVPSQPFDLWCLQLYLLTIPATALWWLPLLWWVVFLILAHFNYLGSADAWMISVLASHFSFMPLLWVLLLACFTGIGHAVIFKQRQLPWLPHLALASLIVTIVQLI